MLGPIARHRSVIATLVLGVLGLLLIGAAQTFHLTWGKIEVDRLVAEVGALLLVLGVLHWLFELGLRREMLREVSAAVVGNTRLHDSGLDSCMIDGRQVDDRAHWERAAELTIGRQYSPRFFKDFYDMLRLRCNHGLPTTVVLLQPGGVAARYLRDSNTGRPEVEARIEEIANLLAEIDPDRCTTLLYHDRVMRYSFIGTNEYIWVKFFTNSPDRATVPALKVRAGTPLFAFFEQDIQRLVRLSRDSY